MVIGDIEKEIEHRTIEEENVRIVRQVFEAFNSGDVNRVHEFISPQYFNHDIKCLRYNILSMQIFCDINYLYCK